MLDSQLSLMENPAMRYLASGVVPGPMGGRHATITPFAIFETADKPIVIANIAGYWTPLATYQFRVDVTPADVSSASFCGLSNSSFNACNGFRTCDCII